MTTEPLWVEGWGAKQVALLVCPHPHPSPSNRLGLDLYNAPLHQAEVPLPGPSLRHRERDTG